MSYLSRYLTISGDIGVPVLTAQTVTDESTPAQLGEAYRAKVLAGQAAWLRQLFVDRAIPCNFTTAEIAVGIEALSRIESCSWGYADDPSAMNKRAAAFDNRYWFQSASR